MTSDSDIRRVTNSELQTFKGCRRRWWLGFHRELTPKRRKLVGPLPLGTRVHAALEADTLGEDALATYVELAAVDRVRWFEQCRELGYEPEKDEIKKFDSQLDLGHIMVEGYIEWAAREGVDAGFTDIVPEEKIDVFFGVFSGQVVHLLGKLDQRLVRARDGARLFVDHKTVGTSLEQKLATMELDEQFSMYQLLERLSGIERGETVVTQGAMINLLRKVKRTGTAKPPFYARVEIHRSEEQLRNFYRRLMGEIDDLIQVEGKLNDGVNHQVAAYPRPSGDCNWICEFRKVCPMFDDGSDAERYLQDHFESYNPLERYAQKEDDAE